MEDEFLIDNNTLRVAAVGDSAQMLVGKVVGQRDVGTELLQSDFAFRARSVRVDEAADGRKISGLEFGDRRTHLRHAADNFMAGNAGIHGGHEATPLITGLVEIGMADAAIQDVDLHVLVRGIPACDGGQRQRRCGAGSGKSF